MSLAYIMHILCSYTLDLSMHTITRSGAYTHIEFYTRRFKYSYERSRSLLLQFVLLYTLRSRRYMAVGTAPSRVYKCTPRRSLWVSYTQRLCVNTGTSVSWVTAPISKRSLYLTRPIFASRTASRPIWPELATQSCHTHNRETSQYDHKVCDICTRSCPHLSLDG